MPCFSQFGGNRQAGERSKSGESQPLQGSFANIWELKIQLRALGKVIFTHYLQRFGDFGSFTWRKVSEVPYRTCFIAHPYFACLNLKFFFLPLTKEDTRTYNILTTGSLLSHKGLKNFL